MIYKKRMKELRENANLTQEKLGNIIGLGRKGFNHVETEYTILTIEKLNFICNYFNVSLDYIFNFTDNKKYENMKSDIDKSLSCKRLKEFRKENKMTQSNLGDALKCSFGTIAGYEKGRYLISTSILFDLCKKYKISADYLLGKIDNPKYFNK